MANYWPGVKLNEYATGSHGAGAVSGTSIVTTDGSAFAIMDTTTGTARAFTGISNVQMMTGYGGYVWAPGKYELFRINPSTGAVTVIPRLDIGSYCYTTCAYGGGIWMGGFTSINDVQRYDVAAGTWTSLAGVNDVYAMGVVGGQLVIVRRNETVVVSGTSIVHTFARSSFNSIPTPTVTVGSKLVLLSTYVRVLDMADESFITSSIRSIYAPGVANPDGTIFFSSGSSLATYDPVADSAIYWPWPSGFSGGRGVFEVAGELWIPSGTR